MKQLNLIMTTTITLISLTACGSSTGVAPSQNNVLNSVSPIKKQEQGYIQEGLDSWLKNEWTPKVEQNTEVREKYMEKVEISKTEEPQTAIISSKEGLNKNTSAELSKKSEEKQITEVKYVEKKNQFPTLQEYLDKADAYFEVQKRDLENSNVEKMKKMPVIGN